jgi:uncharacterized protein YcfJ
MNIAPAPVPKPPVPAVPSGARSLDVNFTGPVTRDEVIGHVPQDGYDPVYTGIGAHTEEVVRPQPVLDAAGQPTWSAQVETLDLTPYSPVKRGLLGGAIGAGVLGAAGAVLGHLTGNVALGAALGGAGGALTGAAVGSLGVLGDTVRPDWELRAVYRHEMNGYSHTAIPQTIQIKTGKDTYTTVTTGYHHTYSPKISSIPVGDKQYWFPVARHSADE